MKALAIVRWIAGLICAAFGCLFALAFYYRYWRWRDCFNELGRCYDPQLQEVFLEQAGIAWGSLTILCFGIAFVLLVLLRQR